MIQYAITVPVGGVCKELLSEHPSMPSKQCDRAKLELRPKLALPVHQSTKVDVKFFKQQSWTLFVAWWCVYGNTTAHIHMTPSEALGNVAMI